MNLINAGLCCTTAVQNAQIYSDGQYCTHCPSTIRSHKQALPENMPFQAESLSASIRSTQRVPRLIYVPDRCRHTYRMIVQSYVPQRFGGF